MCITMSIPRTKHRRIASIQFASTLIVAIGLTIFSFAATTTSSAFLVSSRNSYSSPAAFDTIFAPLSMASEQTAAMTSDGDSPTIKFRPAAAEDIPRCFEIESASYPSDEAATMESLVNRQKYANDYFLLCTNDDSILGFVCGTRCHEFTEESMSALHDPTGPLLAVHSVVISEEYRRQGLATKLLNQYIKNIMEQEHQLKISTGDDESVSLESIVLLAKQHLLGFYVRCGFRVNRPSPIVHGKELWYDLEMEVPSFRKHLLPGESWFCKTETFKKSLKFPEIKPHLDAHTQWVKDLRAQGEVCIVSGYRVDSEGKPGGGGLLFVAAKSYQEAYDLVSKNDPLIIKDCVDWELNGWNSQVGGIQVD